MLSLFVVSAARISDTVFQPHLPEQRMAETSLRQLTMLQLIPRRRPGVTPKELQIALRERDFEIDLRSIQRDLNRLSAAFPLTCDEGRPQRWYWSESAMEITLPPQDPYSAMTMKLIEAHLQPVLPRALRQALEPRFRQADAYLKRAGAQHFQHWVERVRVLPRGLALKPPEVDARILDTLYDGLLRNLQIAIHYRRRDGKRSEMHVHPQALVLRDGMIYLLVTIGEFADLRQIVAHRILSAELTDQKAHPAPGFDLDAYIADGGFDYSWGKRIPLVLRIDPFAGQHLIESPIGPDQQHRMLDDGRLEICVRVNDSEQLRWWLLGFGANIEIVEPEHLRKHLLLQARALVEIYRDE